jgi:hypothetical protein
MAAHSSIRHVSPRKRSRRPQNDAAGEAVLPPIVERPDGFYWIAEGDLGEFGPFGPTRLRAPIATRSARRR